MFSLTGLFSHDLLGCMFWGEIEALVGAYISGCGCVSLRNCKLVN